MTQEQKDLLLKDLCARLPYGVKAEKYTIRIDGEIVPLANIEVVTANDIIARDECPGYTIKPYLFPLSSMTEEQKNDLVKNLDSNIYIKNGEMGFWSLYAANRMDQWNRVFDWCRRNHFDIYGLIPMDLAIDATDKNIY